VVTTGNDRRDANSGSSSAHGIKKCGGGTGVACLQTLQHLESVRRWTLFCA
jgi:hypothetical protein